MKLKYFILILLIASTAFSQNEIVIRKYFFNDGVYLKPQSLYYNNPDYIDYRVILDNIGSVYSIEIPCNDSINKHYCRLDTLFAVVVDNSVYIKQAYENNFYHATIIGALIHFYDIEITYYDSYDDYYYYNYWVTYPIVERRKVNVEYVIELQTGKRFYFNYDNFLKFLKERDELLYNELLHAKKKNKIIYNFLLRYNSRHPLPVPYEEF